MHPGFILTPLVENLAKEPSAVAALDALAIVAALALGARAPLTDNLSQGLT